MLGSHITSVFTDPLLRLVRIVITGHSIQMKALYLAHFTLFAMKPA